MTRWAIGGAMLAAGLATLAWVGGSRPGPEVVVNAPVAPEPAPAPPRPAEPAELPHVVDVTDIDPLLDPPPIPVVAGAAAPVLTAVGYEEAATPAPPAGPVPPIPPAAEDEPAAQPVTLGELPVASVRAGWYGGEWGRIDGKVPDFWAEWVPAPPGFVYPAMPSWPIPRQPSGHGVGVGLYF